MEILIFLVLGVLVFIAVGGVCINNNLCKIRKSNETSQDRMIYLLKDVVKYIQHGNDLLNSVDKRLVGIDEMIQANNRIAKDSKKLLHCVTINTNGLTDQLKALPQQIIDAYEQYQEEKRKKARESFKSVLDVFEKITKEDPNEVEAIRDIAEKPVDKPIDTFIDSNQAAEILGISTSYVHSLKSKGKIKAYKNENGTLRFLKSEIEEFAETRKSRK